MRPFTLILPLGLAAIAGTAHGQIALDPAVTIGTGSQPSGVAIGDFTADGLSDLAIVVEGPDRIEFHAGDGAGGRVLAGSALLPNSSSPGVMGAADLDGDGDLDLMVALKDFLAVQVMFNQGGTFVAGGQFETGDETKSIAFGDFDGDGDVDAITANRRDDSATILRNNGAGSFASNTFAVGGDPRGATFGDFYGDGDLDAAISAHDDRVVDVLRNTNGTFSPWISVSTGAQLRPEGVTAADFNGDGVDDLAAAANGVIGDFAAVWISNGAGFGAMNTYASGGLGASEIIAGDLDCNGLADLSILNIDAASVGVLQNLGGTFGAAGTFGVGVDPEFMAIGDADNDGDQDIAVTSRTANTATLAGSTCGTGGGDPVCGNGVCEPGETTDCVDCQGGGGGPVCGDGVCDPTEGPDCIDCQNNEPGDFTFASTAVAVGTQPGGVAMLDIDGDGDLDLATTVEGPDRVQFTMNMGGGVWTAGAFVATGASSSPSELAAGDFDNDGDADLIVVVRDLMVVRTLRNDGGVFNPAGDAAVGDRAQGIAVGDLDGDGDLDAAVANRLSDTGTILLNTGNGTFTSTDVTVTGEPRGAAVGDFDADGADEVAISSHDTRSILIFQVGAKGVIADGSLSTGPLVRPEGLAAGDFDGDGVTDLAAAVNGGAAEAVMLWTAGSTTGQMFATGVLNTSFIAAVDFNCDGNLDIAAVGTDSNAVAVLEGTGLGTLAPGAPLGTGTSPEQIAIGDIDGNGEVDFATANRDSNDVTVALNDSCPDQGIVGDLNGDGAVDGADAGLLLVYWGTTDPTADLDGSGLVSGGDLGIMLANWTG